MAKTKILNKTPMQPKARLICPKCGVGHYNPQMASEPSARRLCSKCYKKYLEECKEKGTYC